VLVAVGYGLTARRSQDVRRCGQQSHDRQRRSLVLRPRDPSPLLSTPRVRAPSEMTPPPEPRIGAARRLAIARAAKHLRLSTLDLRSCPSTTSVAPAASCLPAPTQPRTRLRSFRRRAERRASAKRS